MSHDFFEIVWVLSGFLAGMSIIFMQHFAKLERDKAYGFWLFLYSFGVFISGIGFTFFKSGNVNYAMSPYLFCGMLVSGMLISRSIYKNFK